MYIYHSIFINEIPCIITDTKIVYIIYIQYIHILPSNSIYTICTKNHLKIVQLYKSKNLWFVYNLLTICSYHVHNQGLRYSHDNKHGTRRERCPIPKNQQKSNSTIQVNQICTVCTNLKNLKKLLDK